MKLRILVPLAFAGALSACASSGGYYGSHRGYADDGYARCYDCGRVDRIERYHGERRASGSGAVLGAVIGGVLGNQVGSGSGRRAATVAGAAVGGVIGHEAEKDRNAAGGYELFVRMDDGRRVVVYQRDLRGIREGDRVVVSGNSARLAAYDW